MDIIDFQFIHDWFFNYVKGFYKTDDFVNMNIALKENHTKEVLKNMAKLTASLKLCESDKILSDACGLLHDVGRFPQFEIYRTFSDPKSKDHAKLGIEVLEQHNVLFSIESYERDIIINSIFNHNKIELPKITDDWILFGKLVRDADKLDIFNITTKYYKKRHESKNEALESASYDTFCSDKVLNAFFEDRRVNYLDVITFNDRILLQLSWLFDLNFTHSIKLVYDNNYIQKMIDELTLDKLLVKKIEDFIHSKLQKNL